MPGWLIATLRVLHVVGVIAWIGGIVVAALIVALSTEEHRRVTAAPARRAALLVATPGMLVAWLAGLTVFIPNIGGTYAGAGWMHAKITVALVAVGMTGALSGMLRKTATGKKDANPTVLRGLAIGILVFAAIVVALVRFKPF